MTNGRDAQPTAGADKPGQDGKARAQQKMRDAGIDQRAIDVFSHYYDQLQDGATGLIPEETIEPLTNPAKLADVEITADQAKDALAQTVMIKLNGGLGTSMGMDKAKSLLPVRDGKTFLDLIVDQVRIAREATGAPLPLVFMNSFRTQQDTLKALEKHADLQVGNLPLDFLQNQEPKLLKDSLQPATWDADPSMEWCPPGHGDIYTALLTSGVLEKLLAAGYKYASVSNSDNLGAAPNAEIAGWFAHSGAPYAAELCRRTVNDRKGGHLAVRKSDGQLILRDTAQTPEDQMDYFTDENRHPFFHTNNLWFNLEAIYAALTERGAVLGLPMIRNEKTVDPSDSDSPAVIQVETAMGAAIEVFKGATCLVVGRDRFLPVKTTNELLLLRSDLYTINDAGQLVQDQPRAPQVSLAGKYYKKIKDFEARIGERAPSLTDATSLTVDGDYTFEKDVTVRGAVTLPATDAPQTVAAGTILEG